METFSFKFSEPQGLVFKESPGQALLLEGCLEGRAVQCEHPPVLHQEAQKPQEPNSLCGDAGGARRPRVDLGSWAPRADASRGRCGAGCWRRCNRFGSWFHLGKDRVGRGLFLCDKSLLGSPAGKLNYQ